MTANPIEQLTGPGEAFELVRAESGGLVYRHAPRSLRDVLIDAGTRATDADYIVYEGSRLSALAHDAQCRQIAAFLYDQIGVRLGDRVAIAMRNLPEFSVALWALQSIGAVAVPLNAWWSGPELASALRHSGSIVLIADPDRLERLRPELDGLALRCLIVTGDAPTAGAISFTGLLTRPAVAEYPAVEVGPDDLATIVYTSGTTGSPKGAMHTHRNYCSAVMHNLLHSEVNRRERLAHAESEPANSDPASSDPANSASIDAKSAQSVTVESTSADPAATVSSPPLDCILLTYPLFHIAGLINLCLSMGSPTQRTKLVLMHHWDAKQAAELIIDEKVTRALLVPTTLRSLLTDGGDQLSAAPDLALHFVAAGGASVPAELIDRIAELFGPKVMPGNGYGLTETTAGCIAGAGVEYTRNPASIGRPLPGMEIRIAEPGAEDSSGPTVPDVATGQVGELVVRGPSVCVGYWDNPEETAKAFVNGWFHTGDLGKIDDNGLYYVVDRIKEVIIRGGENVFCPEVEAVLETHPDVVEAAVFGMPDQQYGETVAAVVRSRPGTSLDEAEVRDHVSARLAYFKVPARVVVVEDELPRTASGKVLKRELRSLL